MRTDINIPGLELKSPQTTEKSTNLYIYGQLVFNRVTRPFNGKIRFKNGIGTAEYAQVKNESGLLPHKLHQKQLKMDQRRKSKSQIYKTLRIWV